MNKIGERKKRAAHGLPLRQVAALAFRWPKNGELEFLVLSSRETHRPVIPKGWPIKGRKDWKAAEIEARQEAGIIGTMTRRRIGQYRYWKRLDRQFLLVRVSVYPLEVTRQLDDWPERHERALLWLTAEDAALLIDETELGTLILAFARELRRKREPAASPPKEQPQTASPQE